MLTMQNVLRLQRRILALTIPLHPPPDLPVPLLEAELARRVGVIAVPELLAQRRSHVGLLSFARHHQDLEE